ncbi:GNAT family N-acetyltransferase [Rouxiella silvae]|uniref:L-ornithine N(alpha)-acyltransferase n=1 Tax=Rouxiella silvae TaxID=1646373 RepID=A0ABX3TUR2_9GAMM|nr:GNAT family N-acyltransferase [Rouxiella silvae]KQN48270.1 acyltransferase [Serratia sp. Leaf50]ORJ18965.1 GNAT family N-acetyltransferase [Rouxiella silvae]
MFSMDNVLQDLAPQRKTPLWQLNLLKQLFREKEFQQLAETNRHLKGVDMVEQILDYFHIRCELSARCLEQIPSYGPVVIVANHPIGTIEGLALLSAVASVRGDAKVVANRLLSQVESLSSLMIPVDNMSNRTGRAQVMMMQEHLENQGVLIVFPAGEVSRVTSKGVRDGRWHTGFVRLAAKTRAAIVPVHISGSNSALFYLSSMIYKPIATLLLVNEMFGHRGSTLKLQIGARIPYDSWHDGHSRAKDLAARFRKHVYRLGQGKPGLFRTESAIARAEDRAVLKHALEASEVLGKTPDGKLIYLYRRHGEDYVPILRELGRLREIAFRAVGEGSGRRRDLDSFDDDYYHLVLWDPQALEIVGAYRFIPTAEQLEKGGINAIYSQSLFNYGHQMDPILAQGIELGRSFIQPAYWGKRGLDYLWLGIGAYLAKYPQYRYLFGPVSISGGLPLVARDLLIAFYRLYFAPSLPLATSRQPYPASLPEVLAQFSGDNYQQDLQCLKRLLANLGCSIPPLYKQYSELCETGGVQFIDFGCDPAFNHCIDGLVLVDLSVLKPSKYERYIAVHHPQPQAEGVSGALS